MRRNFSILNSMTINIKSISTYTHNMYQILQHNFRLIFLSSRDIVLGCNMSQPEMRKNRASNIYNILIQGFPHTTQILIQTHFKSLSIVIETSNNNIQILQIFSHHIPLEQRAGICIAWLLTRHLKYPKQTEISDYKFYFGDIFHKTWRDKNKTIRKRKTRFV